MDGIVKRHFRSALSRKHPTEPPHVQPLMSRITKYSAIFAVVLLAALTGVISKTVVKKTANSQKRPTTEEALRQVAEDINAVAPTQIDASTRLTNAVAMGNTLRYRYTLLNVSYLEVEKGSIGKNHGTALKNSVCSSAGLKPLVELAAILEYAYHDKDGVELEVVPIETSKCR